MFFYEGLSCPHCHTPFREDDDIVACPQCGAPHHRACWKENGGCACADAHGTERQWSRERQEPAAEAAKEEPKDTVVCAHCGADNSPYAEMCSHCGRELNARDWGGAETPPFGSAPTGFGEYAPFHAVVPPLGGVDPRAEIDGEAASDLAAVVAVNTVYYLPRFQCMANGSKTSWNWAAFFFPSLWTLFRKQYVVGGAVLVLKVLLSVISSTLMYRYFASAMQLSENYGAMADEMMRLLQSSESAYLAGALISMLSVVALLINVLLGAFGNRLYMKQCLKTVRATRESYPEGYTAQLGLVGGTSAALAMIGYMAEEFLPMILMTMLI